MAQLKSERATRQRRAEGETTPTRKRSSATKKASPAKKSAGVTLTLTGPERYSIKGYIGNPILRWTQVTMNRAMADHLLSQVSRDRRGREIPIFEEGVVEPPRKRRKSEAELMQELRNKKALDLNPNDPGA
jgi:hypothetical protein